MILQRGVRIILPKNIVKQSLNSVKKEKDPSPISVLQNANLFLTTFNASPNMQCIIRLKDLVYIDVNNTWLEKLNYEKMK